MSIYELIRRTVCLSLLCVANAACAESVSPAPVVIPAAAISVAPASDADLPPYDFPFTNGLYASAAGVLCVKNVTVQCQKTYLLDVPNFCAKFPVRAVIQDSSAPLVIVLLGIDGHPDDDFSKLWPSWFAEAGCHVLTFQSTFRQDFNARSRHGVTGNVWVETEIAKEIIAAFIAQTCVKDRVSKIGLVGMSYGGVESLMLGAMSATGKLPFQVSAIQAYSPPICLQHSAKIVDTWNAETRGKYMLTELMRLAKHVPNRNCPESPIDDCMLKAAAAASFRLPLPALIAHNDREYSLHILPKGGDFDDAYVRADHASSWSFTKFAFQMSYPYWQKKLKIASLEELVRAANLDVLIKLQPPTSEIILCDDDPLNTPEDVRSFKAMSAGKRVTFLPRGGHLGYINEPWTRAKLMTLFR